MADPTPCPSCGRLTATTADGVCVECWAPKTAEARSPFARDPQATPIGLLEDLEDAGLVADVPLWVIGTVVLAVVAMVLGAALALSA